MIHYLTEPVPRYTVYVCCILVGMLSGVYFRLYYRAPRR